MSPQLHTLQQAHAQAHTAHAAPLSLSSLLPMPSSPVVSFLRPQSLTLLLLGLGHFLSAFLVVVPSQTKKKWPRKKRLWHVANLSPAPPLRLSGPLVLTPLSTFPPGFCRCAARQLVNEASEVRVCDCATECCPDPSRSPPPSGWPTRLAVRLSRHTYPRS